MIVRRYSLIAMTCLFAACGAQDDAEPDPTSDELPCGVRPCAANSPDDDVSDSDLEPPGLGKADADDVRGRVTALTSDGELDADDVEDLFDSTGNRVSKSEMAAIREAVEADDSAPYTVADGALDAAYRLAWVANLPEAEAEEIQSGVSFGGTELPAAVRELVGRARLHGAVAYDVRERNDDNETVWTHYPATTPPTHNMTYAYTEITPAKLLADFEDTSVEYNAIVGVETATHPAGFEYKRAKLEKRTGGSGSIAALYDEVYHTDIYARGRNGEKWASNMAILSDGTIHCLPASRRSNAQDVILTNPALSRHSRFEDGKYLLYHGHMSARDGVITDIELSGGPSKKAAKGKVKFIDPIALLEAWGFEMKDGLRLRFGNTSDGTPVRMDDVVMKDPDSE